MTEPNTETPDTPADRPAKSKGRGRRTAVIAGMALAVGLAGAFATAAISKGRHGHHGGDMGFGHMGGPMGFMGGKMDPDKAERRAERMAERFARRIDATGEQESKLIAIAKATVKDVYPLRQQAGDMRKEAAKLLSAPSVDRAAIEKLRADQIARMDAISKRMTTAMGDAAEVLTPEQRQKVAAQMEKRREGRKGWFGRGEGRGRGEGGGQGPDAPAPGTKKE